MRIGGGGGMAMQTMRPQMAQGAKPAAQMGGAMAVTAAAKPSASSPATQPKQVTGMDVLKHLMKGIQGNKNASQQQPKMQAPKAPPATTQESDSSLMTYSRKDMPKFRPSPATQGQQNPFKAAQAGGGGMAAMGRIGGASGGGKR